MQHHLKTSNVNYTGKYLQICHFGIYLNICRSFYKTIDNLLWQFCLRLFWLYQKICARQPGLGGLFWFLIKLCTSLRIFLIPSVFMLLSGKLLMGMANQSLGESLRLYEKQQHMLESYFLALFQKEIQEAP